VERLDLLAALRRRSEPLGRFLVRLVAANLVLLAVLALAAWAALWAFLPPPDGPVAGTGASPVVAVGVVRSGIAKGIGSPFPGCVRDLRVREGQAVTRGQLLFRMDTTTLKARLGQARQAERSAGAAVERTRRARTAALAGLKRRISAAVRASTALNRPPAVALAGGLEETPWSMPAVLEEMLAAEQRQAAERRVAGLRARLVDQQREWHQRVVARIRERRALQEEVRALEAQIAQAKRYAPINGVVTDVRTGEGKPVRTRIPIVRIDDPKGYRVVALLRPRERERLEGAEALRARWDGGASPVQVVRTLDGWGRELFRTWMWLEPAERQGLRPGQRVELVLPSRVAEAR
jgi:multidrug efflux pump subunit AcrA (membrane-fusion protein)